MPSGIHYALASSEQKAAALLSDVSASLWKLVVSGGTGASAPDGRKGFILKSTDDDEPVACIAASAFEERQLTILPFGEVRLSAANKDKRNWMAVPISISFEPAAGPR